jgi:hypothetical protein
VRGLRGHRPWQRTGAVEVTDLDLARAIQRMTKYQRAKARREEAKRQESKGPTLPKPCGCDSPIRVQDDPLMGPRCLRCARSLP